MGERKGERESQTGREGGGGEGGETDRQTGREGGGGGAECSK